MRKGGDLGEKGEEVEVSDSETREEIRDLETEEAGKKHEFDSALEELGEKGEDEMCDLDLEEKIGVSEMKVTKKERREYLDQLRVENQILLRETRDAAFEPAPFVRKPISSVLEKIRLRKEEISKQFLSKKKCKSSDICNEDGSDFNEVEAEEKNEDMDLNTTSRQNPRGQHFSEDSAGPLGNSDSSSNKNVESNPAHQITKRDEGALKYLKDIKWSRVEEPNGFKLEFF